MSLAKEAAEVQENINFDSFWKSEGRGRGPIVTWNGPQAEPGHRFGSELLDKTLEYADAQGMGSGVKDKIREEHERTSALQAIQAIARVS